jgi:hypothetical protein
VLVGAAADDGATLLQVAGAITATTATAGTNTTRVATTAFVVNAKNGATTVNVAGNANVTLTATQAGVGIILLTGALTGSITVYVPPGTGQYIIANNTTGAYTLNVGVSGASGATAIIPQSNSVVAYSDGTNVVLAGAASTSAFTRYWFTASAGQSTFNAIYTVGNVLVTVNGAVQAPSDVTATNSATVTLTGYNGGAGCLGGEEVEIIAFSSFSVANAMTPAGGTFSGPVMLAGGDTGVTAAQFDNTPKLATTAFLQRALGSLANDITLSASTTLTAANVGQNVRVFGSSGVVTLTLPASGTLPNAGSGIWISNLSTFNVTIVTQGSDNFSVTAATSMTLLPNDAIFLVNKNTAWTQLAGSGQLQTAGSFAKSLSTSGYQKLPSGLIIQWGPVAQIAANSSVVVSFPIAYPNAALATVVTAGATASGSPVINGINGAGGGNAKANFQVWNSSASVVTQPGNFISIGY